VQFALVVGADESGQETHVLLCCNMFLANCVCKDVRTRGPSSAVEKEHYKPNSVLQIMFLSHLHVDTCEYIRRTIIII
jgi:hypothetical protein